MVSDLGKPASGLEVFPGEGQFSRIRAGELDTQDSTGECTHWDSYLASLKVATLKRGMLMCAASIWTSHPGCLFIAGQHLCTGDLFRQSNMQ